MYKNGKWSEEAAPVLPFDEQSASAWIQETEHLQLKLNEMPLPYITTGTTAIKVDLTIHSAVFFYR